ncbi:MAG TPA: GDP-mannose 4,6-dehydratase, partial [Anaerolineales bacterium]|nr:GDP-mannose 4,6-dehydratase [Anaerolineales bacterium]
YHREFDLPVVVFRLFNTVGPRQRGRYGMVIPRLVAQALKGEPLTVYGDGNQSRCFCNVRDVIKAVTALAAAPAAEGEIFNIGSQEEVTIRQLAERIAARVPGASREVRLIPYEQAYEVGFEDMLRRVPAIDKIQAAIGWAPTTRLDETLDEVIAWSRERGA